MPKRTQNEGAGGAVFGFGRHRPRIHPTAFVTPGTYIVGMVTIEPRASVWFAYRRRWNRRARAGRRAREA